MKAAIMERREGLLGVAPKYGVLLLGAAAGLYLLGIYMSEAVASVASQAGYNTGILHEVFHDIRHAAGFMCH